MRVHHSEMCCSPANVHLAIPTVGDRQRDRQQHAATSYMPKLPPEKVSKLAIAGLKLHKIVTLCGSIPASIFLGVSFQTVPVSNSRTLTPPIPNKLIHCILSNPIEISHFEASTSINMRECVTME